MLTEADVREALRACFDPEIPLNVVDLGLVLAVNLSSAVDAPGTGIEGVPGRQNLSLRMLATSADEDRRAQMIAQVENRLRGLPQLWRVSVEVEDELWSAARISATGRRTLGLDAAIFPILNNRVK